MKLVKTFEKFRNNQLQVMEVTCKVNSYDDIDDLAYGDYEVNLYINNKYVGDISHVLDDANLLIGLIDSIAWHGIYADQRELKTA